MQSEIPFGVIVGFGNMALTHIERYQQLNQRVVIVETDPDKAQKARHDGYEVFSTLADIPSTRRATFVDICTPTDTHFELIKQAMASNKPILVEKPAVRTTEEAQQLQKLVVSYPQPIMVGEVEMFNNDLKPLLDYQGRPKHINITRNVDLEFFLQGAKPWFLDPEKSGGIVLDLMIHDLTLLIAKFGVPIIEKATGQSVKYNKANGYQHDAIDDVEATLNFGDFTADLHADWITQPNDDKQTQPITTLVEIANQDGTKTHLKSDSYNVRDASSPDDPFTREIGEFIETIDRGKPMYPIQTFLQAVILADKINESPKKTS